MEMRRNDAEDSGVESRSDIAPFAWICLKPHINDWQKKLAIAGATGMASQLT